MSSIFPEFYYKDSGAWSKINQFYYNDAGTWRELREAYYNDNGIWKRFFTNERIEITNQVASQTVNTVPGPATATASYTLTSTGVAQKVDGGASSDIAGEWYSQAPSVGIGADYEVRATQLNKTGGGTLTGTLNTWTSLNSNQSWSFSQTGTSTENFSSIDLLIEIRDSATTTVVTDAEITLSANLIGP